MALSYLFDPNKQFQDKNGVNNVGGYLYVFINDSDDHAPTYCNFTGTLNPERIVLDNNGRAVVIVDELKTYRIEVYDRSGNMLWSQYPVRPTNVIYGDYNVYNADIYGTPSEIDVDVEMSASGVKKFTIKLANAVKTVIGNIQGTISSIVETVSTKADKVQGATAGNLASLDANGNLANSGKKAADFKTKQTAITDPTADGTGLSFIDSVTQNANGEITPHKKTVQDGTTAQKGVVQLQDSIGSTESTTDKAVTPHAVRAAIDAAVSSAYHAAGSKTVAQLTSSLLVAENEGCVYNVTDSGTTTSDFVDGAGHPINAGDNVGVCDVGGGVYKFDLLSGFVDLSNYLTKTGDARNTTSTLTKNASDTSSMTSGGKLSELFTAISDFFASVLSALGGKADKASVTGATKCKITYNGQGIVTGGSDLLDSDIPNLPASKIASGTFSPERIGGTAGTSGQYLKSNGSGNAPSWDNTSNMTAGGLYVPRSNGDLNTQYSKNDFTIVEYQNTASNRPTPNGWYYSLAMCGGDSDFGAQIATGMTIDRIFWRNRKEGTSGNWREIPSFPGTTGVGSPSQPVYVDSEGTVKACGFQVNFGTPIAGANVLNIITA